MGQNQSYINTNLNEEFDITIDDFNNSSRITEKIRGKVHSEFFPIDEKDDNRLFSVLFALKYIFEKEEIKDPIILVLKDKLQNFSYEFLLEKEGDDNFFLLVKEAIKPVFGVNDTPFLYYKQIYNCILLQKIYNHFFLLKGEKIENIRNRDFFHTYLFGLDVNIDEQIHNFKQKFDGN